MVLTPSEGGRGSGSCCGVGDQARPQVSQGLHDLQHHPEVPPGGG